MKFKLIIILTFVSVCMVAVCVYSAGKFYSQGPTDKKNIALTFDDGPGPATQKIVDILNDFKVQGAFFLLGSNVEKNPALVQLIYEHGHEICSHTFSHTNLYPYKQSIPFDVLDCDMKQGIEAISKAIHYQVRYVRIPHGYYRSWVAQVSAKHNVDVVHWTFGCDWQKMSEEEMLAAYLKAVKPGAILLLHDGGSLKMRQKTINILPAIIKGIIDKGYSIVPLAQLLHKP